MTISKIAVAFATVSLLAAAPAFAQGAGTMSKDTSSTMKPTTGAPMKGSNTMMKSGGGTMTKAPVSSENKATATGGQPAAPAEHH